MMLLIKFIVQNVAQKFLIFNTKIILSYERYLKSLGFDSWNSDSPVIKVKFLIKYKFPKNHEVTSVRR